MLILKLQYQIDAADVNESDEAKSSWLVRSLVLQYHTIFNLAKVQEVVAESLLREVVWKSTDKDFTKLRINLVSTVER